MTRECLMWIALVAAVTSSCSMKEANRAWEPPEQPENIEALRALGYIDHAETKADLTRNGARIYLPGRLQPGLNLYTQTRGCAANIIDAAGDVVHSWHIAGCNKLAKADLTPDGHLWVVGKVPRDNALGMTGFVARYDSQGGEEWRRFIEAHHDIEGAHADGGAWVLGLQHRRVDTYPDNNILDDLLWRLDDNGNTLRTLSFWDMVAKSAIAYPLKTIEAHDSVHDVFHSNAIEQLKQPARGTHDPLFAPNNVLVTLRNQDSMFVFDTQTERLVWAWGMGVLAGPHDGTMLDNGHFLVFDNGLGRRNSRVIELDPITQSIVWTYQGEGERAFYTRSRGSAQRLPNGNTLICSSNTGQAVEVTPNGQPVWEFHNPVTNPKGNRAVIVFMRRYATEMLRPLITVPESSAERSP